MIAPCAEPSDGQSTWQSPNRPSIKPPEWPTGHTSPPYLSHMETGEGRECPPCMRSSMGKASSRPPKLSSELHWVHILRAAGSGDLGYHQVSGEAVTPGSLGGKDSLLLEGKSPPAPALQDCHVNAACWSRYLKAFGRRKMHLDKHEN